MSGLDNLNKRLEYRGGNAEGRFQNDKLTSLKRALLYSYQAETVEIPDGRQFRALINPDKTKGDYDNKIISIPFRDICLNQRPGEKGKTTDGLEYIDLKPGDVFTWVETNTKWLVYLRKLEEDAYFRAEIRRCDQEAIINGKPYWVWIRGPVETSIPWNQKGGVEWNDINYSQVMFITKDENTMDFFHRFVTFKIKEEVTEKERTWQVVGVNPYYGDGIVEVFLDEFYENTVADAREEEKRTESRPNKDKEPTAAQIVGPEYVSPYDHVVYTVENCDSGEWWVEQDGIESYFGNQQSICFEIYKTKTKNFTVIYRKEGFEDLTYNVVIQSF